MEVAARLESFQAAAPGLYPLAYRVGYRLTGSRPDAQDIAQETLARALLRWDRIRSFAEAWVARTATNLCLDLHRRAHRRVRIGANTQASTAADRLDLVRTIRRLPRRQRQAVVLRYLADLDEATVATAMRCSAGSVKQHLHRAVTALRADPVLADHAGA